ncbi:MAG: insulinase family protein, partial [Aestuariivirgaceae bacterium]|nr:insulinase family protein [Aestuariivirgaceae bacterium]
LYRSLVIEQQFATEAGAWYSGNALDTGTFGVYAVPQPGKEIAPLETALDALLADIVEKGVTEEELTLAKNLLIAQTTYALDSSAQLARMFGQTLAIGGTVEDVTGWDDRIQNVTLDDVRNAAAEVLVLRASVTSTLLPAPGAAAANGGPAIAIPGTVQN